MRFFAAITDTRRPFLAVRNPSISQPQKRLQAVTTGVGQPIAIAESAGDIDTSYAGEGYGQASWRGADVRTR